jgi:Tfp pilus assembly protein PilO
MKSKNFEKIKFIILIVILILVNLLINRPYFGNLKEVKNQLAAEANRLNQIYNLKVDFNQALTGYQKIKADLITFDEAFLKQGEELGLIKNLEKLAETNNLRQKIELEQDNREISEKIYELDLRLNLTGDFYNLLKYLDELNRLKYQLTVKYLDLTNKGENIDLTILASTYWIYEKK